MSDPVSEAGTIPVNDSTPILAYGPLVLDVPGRPVPLAMKVSAPATGTGLPIILLSHGHGMTTFLSSLRGYGPLADFFAAHGFVVVQPTHLDSTALGLRESDHPEAPTFWKSRPAEISFIIDHLDDIEAAVPGLAGRLDTTRVAAVGHSLGGHTVALLRGMQTRDPADGSTVRVPDERIKAAVIIATPGEADEQTNQDMLNNYPVNKYNDFSTMGMDALVVAGDKDLNPMFSDRLSYRWDAYTRAPGPKTLLMVHGAEHIFGGISGYDASETTDEDPERVSTLRALIWAYLRSQLYPDDPAWNRALAAMGDFGTVEAK
ncbi:alpha/beta fold hydrolase [Actinoplanes sp. LDG1-06]|uniref:Alpha/beta fold hydrolase n=1 Tax=Paractinoplanes ovalisporus TaxID=2810368 RepID=A0ABS2ATY6_9ACTN|nr:alpha/beta fold hydrolase [Actinoplanes ovalisporus]MBM2622671.1 alpha/beta fold hydrolase [Actinoplanes ovalisporus]